MFYIHVLVINDLLYLHLNPIALRTAKTVWSFGRSECNRVTYTFISSTHKTAKMKVNVVEFAYYIDPDEEAEHEPPHLNLLGLLANSLFLSF